MYEKYFALKKKPFHLTPDLDFLFLSAKHKEAISCMEFGVTEDIGIILLTGEVGTGKTTLIRHILQGIENNIDVAAIYNTNVPAEQLFKSIMREYRINSHCDSKAKAGKFLQAHFKHLRSRKRKPILIIDDAQNLSLETLEEIRLIANVQSSVHMLVQIILVGRPELETKLGDPNASSLAQRVSISYHLLPFSREEAEEYIIHRLKRSGSRKNLFTQSAIDLVYSSTQGIPRAINLLCDNAMHHAFYRSTKIIDSICIKDVLKENRNRNMRSGNYLSTKPDKIRRLRPSPEAAFKSPTYAKKNIPDWHIELAHRMEALERFVAASTKEFKTLLHKERQRNEKLLVAYTHLKSKYDTLLKAQLERERLRADIAAKKSLARSSGPHRRVARLVSQKK